LTGIIVSDYGEIHRTTNAGASWSRHTIDTTIRALGDVDFYGSGYGLTIGSGGTILRTTNAGRDWGRRTSGTGEWLREVHILNEHVANVAGEEGAFLRTTNGGTTWSYIQIGEHYFDAVQFVDSLTGLAAGLSGVIFKTMDGGVTWNLKSQGESVWFRGLAFPDSATAIAVGWEGVILRSSDRGETWAKVYGDSLMSLYAVRFFDHKIGLAVGGSVLYTNDGGIRWLRIPTIVTSNGFVSLSFLTRSSAILGGPGGTLLRLTFDEPLSVENGNNTNPKSVQLFPNYPNPFNPSTTIRFAIPQTTNLKLTIFDLLGREVETLVDGVLSAGEHLVEWKPTDAASGIYFYRLQTPLGSFTKKLLLVR
jgi:photosystem II stability/assembly factor-like uncharacterized protein